MIVVHSVVGKEMGSIVYTLSDDSNRDYYLIDIGDWDAARSILPTSALVRGVFITHGHHDHVVGLNKLKECFPECVVYASEEGARMLASAKANLSAYIETPFEFKGDVVVLHDGDKVKLFDDCSLTVLETPGHNPSCLCFQVENYLFTGDSYIPGVKVVTNLPGGSKRIAQETVLKIQRIGQGKTICPGHPTQISDNHD